MFLAKWLVLLGEKGLAFQIFRTYWAHKASVMPGRAQSLQEHVASFYGKLTPTAYSAKESIIISLTVGFPILQVKNIITNGFSTCHTHKTGNMPSLFQCIDDFSKDLPLAPATFRSKEFLIAQLTVQGSFFFDKSNVGHGVFAVSTIKLFWVPRLPQSH